MQKLEHRKWTWRKKYQFDMKSTQLKATRKIKWFVFSILPNQTGGFHIIILTINFDLNFYASVDSISFSAFKTFSLHREFR